MDRVTLLEDLIGVLVHKKMLEARWDFECEGCGEEIEKGGEFCFIGNGGKYCTECRDEAIEEAKVWMAEEGPPPEAVQAGTGGDAAGGATK
ncbi:MAG: hypothetical protein WCP22_03220 [Chlamydiota bacterium]